MKHKKFISFSILLLLVLINNVNAFAQCAMCRTSIESDLKSGGSIANGLNMGIVYLMAVPYIILMIGGYFFFKKSIDAKIKTWRNQFFPAKQS